ncbi:hypothetical protein LCGC14_1083910 [marine sediment metagenome]|uniref:Uncharacterized protein n=1 Tax=marine sediment metagenome TaxID=412755 RepID=A0A0F9MEM5_9ZZZZ
MSTKGSIEYVELGETPNIASVHVYTECFDSEDNIYIESYIQGEAENYTEQIVIRKDVWDELVKRITK